MKNLKQAGFTLIELGIVVAIMTFIAAYLIKQQTQDARMLVAHAQGQQLSSVRDGLYNYSLRNFMAVVNNTAVPGVAVTRSPTVVELSTLNYIPGGVGNNGYYGATYVLNATPSPAACVAPNCNIFVEAHLTAAIKDPFSGSVDGPALGEAVKTIGADGGASFMVPGTIEGQNGAWTLPNPVGAVAGILVARAGVGTQMDFAAYLRRDGTLPMTGDLDMATNDISNAGTIAAKEVTANGNKLSTAITQATVVAHGDIVTKPICPVGETAQIFMAPSFFSNDATGGAIQAVQTYATNNGLTWTANMRILIQTGWVNPSATYGKILVVTKCT